MTSYQDKTLSAYFKPKFALLCTKVDKIKIVLLQSLESNSFIRDSLLLSSI